MLYRWNFHGLAEVERPFPMIDPGSSADLVTGACLLAGTTTNTGGLIRGTGALVDVVGVLKEDAKSADFGTVVAGKLLRKRVAIDTGVVWFAEWDPDSSIDNDVSSATASAVTFTTAQVDDFDLGWMYTKAGTGKGQLRQPGAATTTVMTASTSRNWTTALGTDSDILMILAQNKQLCDVITNATKFKSANATYTGKIHILSNWIHTDSKAYEELVSVDHGVLDGLDSSNPTFWAEFVFQDVWWNKID